MLLALALYVSTPHENTPHYDVDLVYHDWRAHDLDEHKGMMPRGTFHPARRRGGSRAGMDALPQAGRRVVIMPARRRLAAFLEALVREGVHNLLGHRNPAVLLHHP